MRGSTLIIEFHGWRGVDCIGGELGRVFCFGFVSVSFVPFLLSTWLQKRMDAIREVYAARGAYPNKGRPVHRGKEK